MNNWKPIAKVELEALIVEQLSNCTDEQKVIFDNFQAPLKKHNIVRYSKNEKVFVVAIKENEAMYYEDVEEGFNFSLLNPLGLYSPPLGAKKGNRSSG